MSESNILMVAHKQWCNRPADQRFKSLEDMQVATDHWRELARQKPGMNMRDLQVLPSEDELLIVGPAGNPAKMTNWAFGQLASAVKAPAGYLRELSPATAATALNEGLQKLETRETSNLLFQSNGSVLLKAITSDDYTRIWDNEIVSRLRFLVQQDPTWRPAPAAVDGSRGLYASDRDMFAFMVDNERKIFEKQEGGLSRGFIVWNSEVGAASFGIMTFLYEWICGNHRIIGAENVKTFRIPHVGTADQKAFVALSSDLKKYAESSAVEDERRITAAHEYVLGENKEAVTERIFRMPSRPSGLTLRLLENAYDRAEAQEARYGAPNSAWGFTGGLTELSREEPNMNERAKIDRAAGKILELAF